MNRSNYSKREHYSIRKLSIGVASVLIGLSFVGMQNTVVHADVATPATAQTDNQKDSTKQIGSRDTNATASVKLAELAQQSQPEDKPAKQKQSADKAAQNTQIGNNDKKKTPEETSNTKPVNPDKTAQSTQASNHTKLADTESFDVNKAKQNQPISKDQFNTSLAKDDSTSKDATPEKSQNVRDISDTEQIRQIIVHYKYYGGAPDNDNEYVDGAVLNGKNAGKQMKDDNGNPIPDAVLDIYYSRKKNADGTYTPWLWDQTSGDKGHLGYHIVSGKWDNLPSSWGNVIANVPQVKGYHTLKAFTVSPYEPDRNNFNSITANTFVHPTWNDDKYDPNTGMWISLNYKESLAYLDSNKLYEAQSVHTVYYVPDNLASCTFKFNDLDSYEDTPAVVNKINSMYYSVTGEIGDKLTTTQVDQALSHIPKGWVLSDDDNDLPYIYHGVDMDEPFDESYNTVTIDLRHKIDDISDNYTPDQLHEVDRTYGLYITPPLPKYGKRYHSADFNAKYVRKFWKDEVTGKITQDEYYSLGDKSSVTDVNGHHDWDFNVKDGIISSIINLPGYGLKDSLTLGSDAPITNSITYNKDGSITYENEDWDHQFMIESCSITSNSEAVDIAGTKRENYPDMTPYITPNVLKPDKGIFDFDFVGNPEYSTSANVVDGSIIDNEYNDPKGHEPTGVDVNYPNGFTQGYIASGSISPYVAKIFGTYDNPHFDFATYKEYMQKYVDKDGYLNLPDSNQPYTSSISWINGNSYRDYYYDKNGKPILTEDDNLGTPFWYYNYKEYNNIPITPKLLNEFYLPKDGAKEYMYAAANQHLTQAEAKQYNVSNYDKKQWWTQWKPGYEILNSKGISEPYILLMPKLDSKTLQSTNPTYTVSAQLPDGSNQLLLIFKPKYILVEKKNEITNRVVEQPIWQLTNGKSNRFTIDVHNGYSSNLNDVLKAIKDYGLNIVQNSDDTYQLETTIDNHGLTDSTWTIIYKALLKKPDTPQGGNNNKQPTSGQPTSSDNNVQPDKPTTPAKPTKPVDPVSPSQPIQGKKPVKNKKSTKKQNTQKSNKATAKPGNNKPAKTTNTNVKNNKSQKSNTTASPASKPSYNYNNRPHSEIVNGNRINPSSNVMSYSQINPTDSSVIPHGESSLNSEYAAPETYNTKPGEIGSHVTPNGEILPEDDIIAQNGIIINAETHKIVGYIDKNGQPHIALPQTGAKANSKLALLGSALVSLGGLISIVSLLGGDRKRNK